MEIALGKTALEIHFWDEAAAHLQGAVDHSPNEKRALHELAVGYIHLAETRRFYETFKVLNDAPGQMAISTDVHKSFQSCLKALADLQVDETLLDRLAARGNAVHIDAVFVGLLGEHENLCQLRSNGRANVNGCKILRDLTNRFVRIPGQSDGRIGGKRLRVPTRALGNIKVNPRQIAVVRGKDGLQPFLKICPRE